MKRCGRHNTSKKASGFLNLVSITALCFCFLSNTANAQARITAQPGYANTIVSSPTAGVYVISNAGGTFNSTQGSAMVLNHYANFNLAAGETANILLSGSDTSINVVHDAAGLNIAGIVNSLTGNIGSPVGGGLVFVAPNGIVVQPGATINAGSIMLSTSSQSIMSLGPGAFGTADLNDPTHLARLQAQGSNAVGIMNFNNAQGVINIGGTINSANPAPLFHTTATPTFGAGYGVYLLGRSITTQAGSAIWVNQEADVKIMTGTNFIYNLNNDVMYSSLALPAGSGQGQIQVSGTVQCPSGYYDVQVNTADITQNILNITGVLDANAATQGDGGGNITLRMIQPNNSITLNGALGLGQVVANGAGGGGRGGTAFLNTSSLDIVNGGSMEFEQGTGSDQGGSFVIQSSNGTATSIGGAFLPVTSINAISIADTGINPNARGSFMIYDNNTNTGIDVVAPIVFPSGSNLIMHSYNGDTSINTGQVAVTVADGNITLQGNDISVDGQLDSTAGNVILQSRNGCIDITANGQLNTVAGNQVIFNNYATTGPLEIDSAGTITSGGGNNTIGIGSYNGTDLTITQVQLAGPTWGPHAGTYTTNTDVALSATTTPSINATTLEIRLNGAAPAPVPPAPAPAPVADQHQDNADPAANNIEEDNNLPPEEELISMTEAVNDDLELYEKNWEWFDYMQETTEEIINPRHNPSIVLYVNEEEVAKQEETGEFDPSRLFDSCDQNDDFCNMYILDQMAKEQQEASKQDQDLLEAFKNLNDFSLFNKDYLSDSVGSYVVDVLIKGYPYENEYAADEGGLRFTYQAQYHPRGLESFLKKLKAIEDTPSDPDSELQTRDSLFSYKHPPTTERMNKINTIFEAEHMTIENKKVKTNRFQKYTGNL